MNSDTTALMLRVEALENKILMLTTLLDAWTEGYITEQAITPRKEANESLRTDQAVAGT